MNIKVLIERHWKTVCVIVGCWTFLALLFTPQTYLANLRSPAPLTWGQALFASLTLFYVWAWEKLSAVPQAEQCGWLKDKYGLSWQVAPTLMDQMMQDDDPERMARVTKAFLPMKKFDLAELQRAYDGK